MALPLLQLRSLLEPRGFRSCHLIQAAEAHEVPGLGDLAENVRDGLVPPSTPQVVAVRESTGGYPPVAVSVPITNADAVLLLQGDILTAHDVATMLEEAADAFLVQARTGRFT